MNDSKQITLSQDEVLEIHKSFHITAVSGSFDLVHLGHLRFLHCAKEINPENKLLVILLSDRIIKERKGPKRPFFNQEKRIEFLSYLKDVDYIVIWDQSLDELRKFTQELKSEVFVVNEGDPGLENKRENVERYGGKFVIFKRSDDYSTTKIISDIKNL